MKIGLVGAGRMGALHARNAAASIRLELASIADHNLDAASELARELGADTTTFDDMLNDASLAGIIVVSSTSSHLDHVEAAVAAGKAVFCEKPLSLNCRLLEQALPKLEAAGAPPVMVGFNRRFDPHLTALKARLEQSEAGVIESMLIINHDPAAPSLEFIPRSGGLFKDFTIHDFDTAAWLLADEIVEVFATASCLVDSAIAKLGDVDTAKTILRTRGGAICVISNTRRSGYGYDQRVEMFGSKGAIGVENITANAVVRRSGDGVARAPIPYSFVERYAEAYRAELDHFADVVSGRVPAATGPRNSLHALRLAEAAEQSVKQGRPVKLSG